MTFAAVYHRLNVRFTTISDWVSEAMGRPWTTIAALVFVLGWLADGPRSHFSDSWQLAINTPTTIAELFIGFLLGAAANRAERRHAQQLDRLESKLDAMIAGQDGSRE